MDEVRIMNEGSFAEYFEELEVAGDVGMGFVDFESDDVVDLEEELVVGERVLRVVVVDLENETEEFEELVDDFLVVDEMVLVVVEIAVQVESEGGEEGEAVVLNLVESD